MPLPPLLADQVLRWDDKPDLHLFGSTSQLKLAHRYLLCPDPNRQTGDDRTALIFGVRLEAGGATEPFGFITDIRVCEKDRRKGLGTHLVTTALGLARECRLWHVRTIVEDGPYFWPLLCPELAEQFGVTFELHFPKPPPE